MLRACLLAVCASLALATAPVWAHPHGSASCSAQLIYNGSSVSKVIVTLELDAEHSNKVFESMQTKADGTFSPEQRSRMQSNLAYIFGPINYLLSLQSGPSGAANSLSLRSSSLPEIERSKESRLRITAELARADTAQENENNIAVRCADPSWHWLVGFKGEQHVTSNRNCRTKLGDDFIFALPNNLPMLDGPSLKVTTDHLPKSQRASLVCS
jgi:ABC-type uncharacterized transport system substrate-binding protein